MTANKQRFQLLTMTQDNNLDFMPQDNHAVWDVVGAYETYAEARDAASDYVNSFAPVVWMTLNQHLDIGCCTPMYHPRDDKVRQWFKIFGVK